jgi:DeoR family transcriptional regulator, glycerol-3-phosphate regulon repressor
MIWSGHGDGGRADIGIIGISGIDLDGGLFDFDLDEVICAQTIIRNSRRLFFATGHSKFGHPALVRVGHITKISALYTDAPPPAPIAAILQTAGVPVPLPD